MKKSRKSIFAVILLLCVTAAVAQDIPERADSIRYSISLANASNHLLRIRVNLPRGSSERTLRLPVWNALYQVRDFAQYIESMKAEAPGGSLLTMRQVETSAWQISGAENGAVLEYSIHANNPGPYGSQVNDHHAFLNFAEVLLYESGTTHDVPVTVQFTDVPQSWKFGAALKQSNAESGGPGTPAFAADSYDRLVDAPIELSDFREIAFRDGVTDYRILIDADPSDYDETAIESSARRIVREETDWMRDQPCAQYVFIYHFLHGQGGGGMEHACSTAIDVSAERMNGGDTSAFDSVTAHEFFHQWNVKRIRPQSLEPVDYSKAQYTRALWFSEGVTSAVEDMVLLRTGLITSTEYLRRLSVEIDTLQHRPAHTLQSAEESSLQAWFEKYPFYRRSERSISYYNKGEILGVMLDLAIRDATEGRKSLRDLFLWMNEHYAKQGKFFADSEGVQLAAEAVTGKDFKEFFADYVSGTVEIPYDRFLKTAGLQILEQRVTVIAPGFTFSRNFDAAPTVLSVQPGSEAERAGLKVGDAIVEANGRASLNDALSNSHPGDTLRLRVNSRGREHEMKFKTGSTDTIHYAIADIDHPTEAQMRRRTEWLSTPAQQVLSQPSLQATQP